MKQRILGMATGFERYILLLHCFVKVFDSNSAAFSDDFTAPTFAFRLGKKPRP
jgi:hypothetical protein